MLKQKTQSSNTPENLKLQTLKQSEAQSSSVNVSIAAKAAKPKHLRARAREICPTSSMNWRNGEDEGH